MNNSIVSKIFAVVAIVFGLMTLRSGGSTLFLEETRQAAGDIVLFVLWVNFILGFAYIVAGIGLFIGKPWAKNLAIGIAGITLLTYAAFGINIAMGGIYKIKTVKAMAVRSIVWIVIAYQSISMSKANASTL